MGPVQSCQRAGRPAVGDGSDVATAMIGERGRGRTGAEADHSIHYWHLWYHLAASTPHVVRFARIHFAGSGGMAIVEFSWSPVLVDLRREVCPAARWQKQGRQWLMTEDAAAAFLNAAQARLDFVRVSAEIRVNGVAWLVGFAAGAPRRIGVKERQGRTMATPAR